jgi:hypothetical protein
MHWLATSDSKKPQAHSFHQVEAGLLFASAQNLYYKAFSRFKVSGELFN